MTQQKHGRATRLVPSTVVFISAKSAAHQHLQPAVVGQLGSNSVPQTACQNLQCVSERLAGNSVMVWCPRLQHVRGRWQLISCAYAS